MKLIKLTSILLSTSMIAGGFAPAFTTLVSAEVAKTASSTNTTEITSAVGADWTLNSNSTVKNAETILAQATNINLNSHTLTIDGGWYIAPGKSVEITGSGTVELTGEAYCGLPANATWGMIVVGNRGTEPNSASLTIESGVTVTSSTGNGATVLVTPSGKLTSSGIISNTAQTGNTTALTLGAEVNTANDTNGPEVTLNQNSKVNSQNGRAIHVLGYTRGAVLEAYGSSITGGSSRTGIGIYYAGSGKATISDCTISASLAILNIGGNFTISDPNISSTGTDTGTEIDYGSGYKGPNAAIVVALNNGNYNSSQAAIKLSGEGSLEDKNTSAHNSIMIYTREEDGVYEQNTTNKNNLDGNGATIVTMNSPQIDFSAPIPPNYLSDGLNIQLSNTTGTSKTYSYIQSTVDKLVEEYYKTPNSSTDIYTSTTSDNATAWNSTGVTLTFMNGNSTYISIPLYVGNGTSIAIPTNPIPHRTDYTFGGWSSTQTGTTAVTSITTTGAGENLPAQSLYAIWTYNPPYVPPTNPTPTPPEVNQPDDNPVTDNNTNTDNFTPNSGVNSGVIGTGPGFTENGSVTTAGATTGNSYTYTQNENGTKAAVTQSVDGDIVYVVLTVPQSAIQNGVAAVDLGTNTETNQPLTIPGDDTVSSTAPVVTINLPSSTTATRVQVNLTQGTALPGTVAMSQSSRSGLTPIAKTTLSGNTLSVPVTGSQRITIMDNAMTFSDQNTALQYAQNASSFMSARDLMTGMGTTTPKPFAYLSKLTRGQFATIVWRLEGSPQTTGTYPVGITPGAWNADAARWAVQNNLMGQGSLFNAEQDITREQLVTILYRFVNSPSVDTSVLNNYSDANQIYPADFRPAMAWGVSEGLIGQGTNGKLDPASNASRMNVAAIFQRFIEKEY